MPYPNALPSAPLRFAHAPELLLFAVDTSDEAKLPASRPQPAADAASPSSPPTPPPTPPTRFDALASCALLIARAKASLAGGHRMALLSVGPERASFVPGSLCGGAQQLEAALSRLRAEALGGDRGGDDGARLDFATLVDAAADAAARSSSPSASVRVVLLLSRSRPPAPLPRERALEALWRRRHGALGARALHVDALYAYDPSPGAAPAAAAQETFSQLEANVDALSAAALAAFPPESCSSDAAARHARARGHSYVLDASVFAARRLMAAACQLVSHPLQRPAGARPAAARDLAKAPRAPLPSEAGGGGGRKQQQQEQQQQRQEQQSQQRADEEEEEDEEGAWGGGGGGGGGPREWGLPLPPPQPSPPPPPAPHSQLLVDITSQLQRASVVRQEPSSFPLMASGRETTDEGSSGLGDDVAAAAAADGLRPAAETPLPQPLPLGVQPPPPPGAT